MADPGSSATFPARFAVLWPALRPIQRQGDDLRCAGLDLAASGNRHKDNLPTWEGGNVDSRRAAGGTHDRRARGERLRPDDGAGHVYARTSPVSAAATARATMPQGLHAAQGGSRKARHDAEEGDGGKKQAL